MATSNAVARGRMSSPSGEVTENSFVFGIVTSALDTTHPPKSLWLFGPPSLAREGHRNRSFGTRLLIKFDFGLSKIYPLRLLASQKQARTSPEVRGCW